VARSECKGMHESEFGRRSLMVYAEKERHAFLGVRRFPDEISCVFDPCGISL
jgi:hypothetical protein